MRTYPDTVASCQRQHPFVARSQPATQLIGRNRVPTRAHGGYYRCRKAEFTFDVDRPGRPGTLGFQVRLPEDAQRIADLLSRLSDEKATAEAEDYAAGKRDGLNYATSASYGEFRKFERVAAELQDGKGKPRWFRPDDNDFQLSDDAVADLYDRIIAEEVIDDRLYRQGWLDGMMTVWREVKKKI